MYFKQKIDSTKQYLIIDTFIHVKNTILNRIYAERYFPLVYDILKKANKNYLILPRMVETNSKNPFEIIKFFKIMNKDSNDYIFEYGLLSLKNLIQLFVLIILYPFKTLRLLQKENTEIDIIFNNELVQNIQNQNFNTFSRFIFGQNISKLNNIKHIYSWSEFQVIERSFNYGIKSNNKNIVLCGCQFYINYETYFNAHLSKIDYINNYAYDKIFVNGTYYKKISNTIEYIDGVSLRYNNIFKFKNAFTDYKTILVLGTHDILETKDILESIAKFTYKIIFKNHPDNSISYYKDLLSKYNNIFYKNENIYELFKISDMVITGASGTSLEAVSCGLSVVIMSNKHNFTIYPLLENGKGLIWNISYDNDDLIFIIKQLYNNRKNKLDNIKQISSWYKLNFFIEPNNKNIKKVFEI
jgi:hypothetical protein